MNPTPAEPESASETPEVPSASDRMIACELPCIHCGYDLRTIRLSALCPECGKVCADSMKALSVAHVEDLARARRGVVLLILAALAPLLAIGYGVLGIVLESWGPEWARLGDESYPWVFGLCLAVVIPVLAVGGAFRVTSPLRPLVATGAPSPRLGRVVGLAWRWVVCGYAVASVMAFAFMMLLFKSYDSGEVRVWCVVLSLAAAAHTWTAWSVLACRYLARVARLGDAPRLARWLRVLSWYAAAMFGYVAMVSGVILMLYVFRNELDAIGRNNSRPWISFVMFAWGILSSVGSLGMLGWLVAWPVTLTLVLRRVRHAERAVRAHGGAVLAASAG